MSPARLSVQSLPHQALLLTLPISLFDILALVILFLAFGQPDLQLDPAALVMQVQRNQCVARTLHLADQSPQLFGVHQQFAGAGRVGLYMRGRGQQRADMTADQVQPTVAQDYVGFRELHAACANGFRLPALQGDAGFEALLDEVIMECLAVFYDAHT